MPIRARNVSQSGGRDTNLGMPVQWTYFNPAADAVNAVQQDITSATTPALAVGTDAEVVPTTTNFTQVDTPRILTATLTDGDGSITYGHVDLYGTDFWGNKVSERIVLAAGSTVEGTQVFRSISKAIIHVEGAVTATVDTVEIGTTDKLGLPVRISSGTDILNVWYGELEGGSGGVVDPMVKATQVDTANGAGKYLLTTTAIAQDWFQPGDACNGVLDYVVEAMSTYDVSDINMS